MTGPVAPEPAVRLSWIARPAVVVAALVVVVLLIAAAFVVGLNIQAPGSSDASKQAKPVVTARVEMRAVTKGIEVPGKVVLPTESDLKLVGTGTLGVVSGSPAGPATEEGNKEGNEEGNKEGTEKPAETKAEPEKAPAQAQPPSAERNVVTHMFATKGAVLAAGTVLAEVSGRPIVAVNPGTPLYRDLVAGAVGEDVHALQQLLADQGYAVDVDGILDADTMNTAAYWYTQLGYTLPTAPSGGLGIPWRELLPIPNGQSTVISASPVGDPVGEAALLKIQRGAPRVEITIASTQRQFFQPGGTVYVRSNGKALPAEVLSVGELVTDAETGASGHPVKIRFPEELIAKAAEIQTVLVSTEKPKDATFAVPLVAIQEDGAGQFVFLDDAATDDSKESAAVADEKRTRVDIEVTATAGGWAAVAPNDKLPEGTKVYVSQ